MPLEEITNDSNWDNEEERLFLLKPEEFLKAKKEMEERHKKEFREILSPPGLTTMEKICYWTNGISNIPLKISILGTIISGGSQNGLYATGITSLLYFGSLYLMQYSYNKRHSNPGERMELEFVLFKKVDE